MNKTASLCPYCNAVLPPLSAAPTTEKLPCPRCGEAVPASRWHVDPTANAIQAGLAASAPRGFELREPVPGIRKTALVVVSIMLTMAIIGGSYALWTVKLRRSRDPWMPKKLEPIAFRRPLELTGLGHLPQNCQIVAGLHIAEMVNDEKVGKKLLAEPRPALLDWSLKQVTRTTGMTLEELDHVVLGLAFDTHFPQLVMVVKARSKISLEKLADARPARSSFHQQQPLYEFSLKPAGEALLWCVDDQTIVCVIRLDAPRTEHLSGLSVQARPIDEVLAGPLKATMSNRLPKHNFLWAAGQLDQLGAAKDFLPLILGAKADLGTINDMRAFTLGIAPVDGLTLTGHFLMNDAKATAKLQSSLDDVKIAGATSQKVEATPPEVAEQWVTWQVRGDVTVVRAMLGGGKDGKK